MRPWQAALVALILAAGCGDDPAGPSGEDWQSYTTGDVVFEWRIEEDGTVLHVRLEAPTTGWVAVGFEPTVLMKDANLIIGYSENDSEYIRDDFGTNVTSHEADLSLGGTSDVTLLGGGQVGNRTNMEFSIPMASGDAYDVVLTQGTTHTIILAYGPSGGDDFTSAHQFAEAVSLEL